MMRTIILGSCVMVQGHYVKTLSDGRIVIKVDGRLMAGRPATQAKAA
ncbi:hypothetical protein O2N63_02865 [Aliiroseovarius sp. KMU-50]|uniref:Translation initiation factor 2 n=1 Tax=Aliiroseovarius salicola TaxID=3009082 RepID=A0ABT4VZQ9_9RHOB|nr:hypothetical protein [Aliiroseovarius sp. KMU-50]MDA5093018.1 hypothetical protein [Aliiroseovarius sp. KMU-50]